MATKLRARAEAVKNEICNTADECVKRILVRRQEMMLKVYALFLITRSIYVVAKIPIFPVQLQVLKQQKRDSRDEINSVTDIPFTTSP